jgi:drug/metabolite transporter (DMT)-like permease
MGMGESGKQCHVRNRKDRASSMTYPTDRAVAANPVVSPSAPADRNAPVRPSPAGWLVGRSAHRAWSSAWTLLFLTNLFWAGNIVIGRAVAGRVPPITLAYWRWTGAFFVAFGFAWPHLKKDWPELLRRWRMLLLLAATGIATYNTMSYIGLQYTTALNALLLQSAMPVIVLLWDFGLFGARPSLWQVLGVALSLLGVLAIVSQLSPAVLAHISINIGDLWLLGALVVTGLYVPLLRRRPAVHSLSLLVTLIGIGSFMILPFYLWEVGNGAAVRGGLPSYAAIAYAAVLPSFVAYLFFNRGVELIGPGRAGQSAHLMPVLGAILAVLFLGERFHLYHVVGILLIAAGILLASKKSPAARLPSG